MSSCMRWYELQPYVLIHIYKYGIGCVTNNRILYLLLVLGHITTKAAGLCFLQVFCAEDRGVYISDCRIPICYICTFLDEPGTLRAIQFPPRGAIYR